MKRLVFAFGTLLAIAAIAGCAGDAAGDTSGADEVSPEQAQIPVPVTEAAAESEPEPEADPESEPAGSGDDQVDEPADQPQPSASGPECIIGSWIMNNEGFGELMSELGEQVIDDVTGVARFIAAADGSAITQYEDWVNHVQMPELGGEVIMTRNGEDGGTYTANADGTFSLQETDMQSTIVVEMYSGGSLMSSQSITGSEGALHLAVFTCAGNELTVTVDGRSTVMQREEP